MNLQTCIKQIGPERKPCGDQAEYLSAQDAQAKQRGPYSGWYHVNPGHDHHAVPKSWVA